MNDYLDTNRALWDGWTKLHASSAFYDVDGFKAGASTLKPVERNELGEVTGKTLLHLQCHFGLDTLSWAREGAVVTGVDFSEEAIARARSLSAELDLPATFLCSNLYDLPEVLDATFDIVFTSYGVLPWLPDLDRWAQIVARYLKPGGTFYLVEFHPFVSMLDDAGERIAYPYFLGDEPLAFEEAGSYAEPEADFTHTAYEWPHSLGEIVTALLKAGLRLDFLHEFPYSTHPFPWYLDEEQPDRYVWKDRAITVPLMFSIKAGR